MLTGKLKNSAGFRIIIIFIITLVMLIPAQMIRSLIRERESRQIEVVSEISKKWGEQQIFIGPILTIPYKKHHKTTDNPSSYSNHYLYILPDILNISGILAPEVRHRGIYEAVLYRADLVFEGDFDLSDLHQYNLEEQDLILDKAFITIGISDLKGIKNNPVLTWGDTQFEGEPGVYQFSPLASGITIGLENLNIKDKIEYSFSLTLNGSRQFKLAPLGKLTTVDLSSSWKNPSFSGSFLPDKHDFDSGGFHASWKILHYNRNYPQKWTDINQADKIELSAFGVELILPVDHYQKTMRTIKYCFLFIGLTFTAFFMLEILTKKILHPLQYILIGFGLVLFYSLLLSLTEHLGFNLAYLLACIFIISLISIYSKWIIKRKYLSLIIAMVMSILYGFLFILLQLQDYSLLIGSLGLLFILGLIMYITRKIDWFDINPDA